MASLSVQALRQIPLEKLLEIGFDRLPASDDFYKALGEKLHPKLKTYYDSVGWLSLETDILFLTQNEKQPLIYKYNTDEDDNIIYWRRQNGKYLLISWIHRRPANYYGISHVFHETLEALVGEVLYNVSKEHQGSIAKQLNIFPDFREIFGLMAKQHQEQVDEFYDHLRNGGFINIVEYLPNFSFYGLDEIDSGYLVLDEEKLTIVLYRLIKDGGYGTFKPDITWVPAEDARLILSILAYNPDKYQLV